MTSFYTEEELRKLGFNKLGKNVLISRKASFYRCDEISMGDNVRIDDFCILSGKISLGNYIHIAAYSALYAGKYEIIFKDFVTVSSRNIIYAESDDYTGPSLTFPNLNEEFRKTYGANVIFEKHVLLGTNCTVLPGVTLGEGVSVGAMSLVKQSMEAWNVYSGIPARKIKERSREILLLEKEYLKRGNTDE